jgi:FKBP-type peptidyl-prolyl cis-trans isomerase (trigger factor)
MQDTPYEVAIKKMPRSTVELTVTVPAAEWEKHRVEAVEELNEHVNLDGFRKGKVPESVLIQKLGERVIIEEMAEIAVSHAYGAIIRDKKLHPVGRPKVELTKIAKGNPLEFHLTTAVLPEVSLPDYVRLAKKNGALEKADVEGKEVEEAVTRIMEMRAHEGHDHAADPDHKETKIPELTDEYVKTLGNFATVAEFKEKLRGQIAEEKTQKARDKRRSAILDAIVEKTDLELPDVIIDGEVERMVDQFKGDIARVGGTWEDYLKHSKKTDESIRKEWRSDGEKRAKTQLVIDAIGEKEKIQPRDEDVAAHVKALRSAYPEADKEKAENYVRYTETNRLVIAFLEKTADEK